MTYFSLVSLALVDEAEYSSLCTLCVNKLEHFQWRLKDTKLKNFNEILVEPKKMPLQLTVLKSCKRSKSKNILEIYIDPQFHKQITMIEVHLNLDSDIFESFWDLLILVLVMIVKKY